MVGASTTFQFENLIVNRTFVSRVHTSSERTCQISVAVSAVETIMTAGEICLLIPNRPLSFGDKVDQLRRRRGAQPRCLFGPPDPAETERLIKEELQRERERFQKRWNIDLDSLEVEIEKRESTAQRAKLADLGALPSGEPDRRLPPEIEVRLSSPSEVEEAKTAIRPVATLRKTAVCRKPSNKFQKRVRVTGSVKRQTHLTGTN